MSAARRRLMTLGVVSLVAVAGQGVGWAQDPQEVRTTREYCVKVLPGKARAYEAFLRDVTLPLNRARAESGEFEAFAVERALIPAGTSARCDYRLAYTYKGTPPEEATNEQLGAALKRAGLPLTADQLSDQRAALIQLVGLDFWYSIDAVGPDWQKGSYLTFNHYNVKEGQSDEFVRLERTWKALVEARVKAGGKSSWALVGLWLPSGDAVPYNAMTIDVEPSWADLMKTPSNFLAEWAAVHPGTPFMEVEAQKAKVRSVHARELYKLVEIVRRSGGPN